MGEGERTRKKRATNKSKQAEQRANLNVRRHIKGCSKKRVS